MSVTIADVLDLPVLRRGVPEVVVGADLLERPVRWVHAAEVPNIATLLKGGELLLTTGLGLGATAAQQRATAAALARRGVAGLVLELGTTFPALPVALARACARHALPLVVLHRPVPFVEVTETIHAEIVNGQFALMQRGEELHRRFTDLMLRGAGVPEVLEALADATGSPVLLRRGGSSGEVIAQAAAGRSHGDVLAAWDAHLRRLPSAPRTLERPVPSRDPATPAGALVLLEPGGDEPDGFAAVALERAVALVGLALVQDHAEETLAHRERGALLGDVLRGGVGESEAVERAAAFGFRSEQLLLPVAVGRRARRIGRLTADEDARWTSIWRELRRELDDRRASALLAGADDHGLIVLGLRRDETRAEAAQRLAQLVRAETERQLGSASGAVVCAGRAVASWSELGDAMDQVLATLPAATAVRDRSWHDAAAPDVDRLFASLRDEPELRAFVELRLGPVLAHDERRAAKLLPTLAAYCEHGGRKAATAAALGLQRPSLYHRLERLEALLGAPLSDPDTLLGVHVALRVRAGLGG